MKRFTIKSPTFFNICLALVVLTLGACKKDKDNSPEFYIKFKADKNYELIGPKDTVTVNSGSSVTNIEARYYNWPKAGVEGAFIDMGIDGSLTTKGPHTITNMIISTLNNNFSIKTPGTNVTITKKGTLTVNSFDSATKTSTGSFSFEVGAQYQTKNNVYTLVPITVPTISGTFQIKTP